jgi:hypothetical protein
MSTHRTTILASLLQPGGGRTYLNVTLTYDSTDPIAVKAWFHTQDPTPVEWVFAREVLLLGVDEKTAEDADVVAWPVRNVFGDPRGFILKISSPFGQAAFEFPYQEIVDFLNATYALVPMGFEAEHIDFDAELAHLLGGDTL